jgi:hypothetical protein
MFPVQTPYVCSLEIVKTDTFVRSGLIARETSHVGAPPAFLVAYRAAIGAMTGSKTKMPAGRRRSQKDARPPVFLAGTAHLAGSKRRVRKYFTLLGPVFRQGDWRPRQ